MKAGCGSSRKIVSYLVAEKAGIALNPFRPQGQTVAVRKVVDRGCRSATRSEGIRITRRSLGGLVRGNDLFIVEEKYYIAISNSLPNQRKAAAAPQSSAPREDGWG